MSGRRDKYQAVARAAMAPADEESSVVAGHDGNATVSGVQGRGGVEAEPAESQDQRAHHGHGQIVAGNGRDRFVAPVLAHARAEDDRARQGGHPPSHVHHRRAGKVDMAMPEAQVDTQLGPASRRPTPSCHRAGTETWT